MPKITTPLTNAKIQKSKAKEKDYTLPDGGGLQLLIKKNETKLWEFYYQSPTKFKRRKTSFGTYPQTTLIQAREKRTLYKELIFKGIDPIDYHQGVKADFFISDGGLFENVLNEWLIKKRRDVQEGIIVEKTYQRAESLLLNDTLPYFKRVKDSNIKPILPNAHIKDIKHFHIVKVVEDKNLNAPVSAKRLLQYLNKVWLFAISKGYCDDNILTKIDNQSILTSTTAKNMPKVVNLEVLKELVNAIYSYRGHYSTKNALKFVLHVPLRADNLVCLKWKYVDFENKLLTIPRPLMKNKNPNLPDFIIPLTDEVISILKEQNKFTYNREYVFVADNGIHLNQETPNKALQRMGFNDEKRERKQRLHSFRGTFRSLLDTYQLEHNIPFEIKELSLDHYTKNMVELAYTNRASYTEQLKPLMRYWSDFIVKMIDE